MLPYTIDFLAGLEVERPNDDGRASLYTTRPISASLDRSTGSPHSSKSSSTDGCDTLMEVFGALEKQAEILGRWSSVEKPSHSYIALISLAILSTRDKKMLLGDIYQYIMDKFPYYNNTEKAWRNSIRYNLSINECFIKNGRSDSGKGNYWSIHPACVEDFGKGDFRRRHARRRTRKGARDTSRGNSSSMEACPKPGYSPMSSVPIEYQSMTQLGYQPMTSTLTGYQAVMPVPVSYQSLASACEQYESVFPRYPSQLYLPPLLDNCESTSVFSRYHPYQRSAQIKSIYSQSDDIKERLLSYVPQLYKPSGNGFSKPSTASVSCV